MKRGLRLLTLSTFAGAFLLTSSEQILAGWQRVDYFDKDTRVLYKVLANTPIESWGDLPIFALSISCYSGEPVVVIETDGPLNTLDTVDASQRWEINGMGKDVQTVQLLLSPNRMVGLMSNAQGDARAFIRTAASAQQIGNRGGLLRYSLLIMDMFGRTGSAIFDVVDGAEGVRPIVRECLSERKGPVLEHESFYFDEVSI